MNYTDWKDWRTVEYRIRDKHGFRHRRIIDGKGYREALIWPRIFWGFTGSTLKYRNN